MSDGAPAQAPPTDVAAAALKRFTARFDGVLRLDIEDDGRLWIDGRVEPPAIAAAPPAALAPDGTALCAWRAARATLLRVFEDDRALATEFVAGRLDIAGDMSVIVRLARARGAHG